MCCKLSKSETANSTVTAAAVAITANTKNSSESNNDNGNNGISTVSSIITKVKLIEILSPPVCAGIVTSQNNREVLSDGKTKSKFVANSQFGKRF